MSEKESKIITCDNLICREYICHSDGEFLFVENLEIMPKVKNVTHKNPSIRKSLLCPRCGWEKIVWLKKNAEGNVPKTKEGRKFLIFRSRF